MKLRYSSVTDSITSTSRSIEYMGDKFVLVTITIDAPTPEKSYFFKGGFQWRLYDKAEPLIASLDIRDDIDVSNGIFTEIRFFISEPFIQKSVRMLNQEKIQGVPILGLDCKETNDGYYHEQMGNYTFYLIDNFLYCLFGDIEVATVIQINEEFGCLLDCQKELSGFFISNLSDQEIKVFHNANLV
ncbi:hypothetical protein [Brevibacillus laterosporus]|uniref:Uncharacterized protein n=1 Tax=Brevibacillus laterosporus LMG 15441 TaxID=1042163 RepID=A0A075R605_BRELA|nr:hypothetical protein [Brevibacillus laterosporus]AIG26588.1 hypothetical protein BRLA_c022670 [Brevibacillus laterosporus LMG 15441]